MHGNFVLSCKTNIIQTQFCRFFSTKYIYTWTTVSQLKTRRANTLFTYFGHDILKVVDEISTLLWSPECPNAFFQFLRYFGFMFSSQEWFQDTPYILYRIYMYVWTGRGCWPPVDALLPVVHLCVLAGVLVIVILLETMAKQKTLLDKWYQSSIQDVCIPCSY